MLLLLSENLTSFPPLSFISPVSLITMCCFSFFSITPAPSFSKCAGQFYSSEYMLIVALAGWLRGFALCVSFILRGYKSVQSVTWAYKNLYYHSFYYHHYTRGRLPLKQASRYHPQRIHSC